MLKNLILRQRTERRVHILQMLKNLILEINKNQILEINKVPNDPKVRFRHRITIYCKCSRDLILDKHLHRVLYPASAQTPTIGSTQEPNIGGTRQPNTYNHRSPFTYQAQGNTRKRLILEIDKQ